MGTIEPTEKYFAALYMRLSKDDEGAAESASISTQRKMLRAYAQDHNYCVYDEYVDGSDKIGLNRKGAYNGDAGLALRPHVSFISGRTFIMINELAEIRCGKTI